MSQIQEEIDKELSIDLSDFKGSDFNCKILIGAFHQSACKTHESLPHHDDVALKEYCIAYKEVIKFLEKLGAVFYFVIIDIREKIVILENFLEDNPVNYETITKMVEYEKSEKHLVAKQEKPNNGARTILRLHRALLFIYKLLNNLYIAESETKSSDICVAAYDTTLAEYHTWIVRKAARFGMKAMPRRDVIIGYMSKDREEIEKFPKFVPKILNVYNITQVIYEKHQLLELP